MHIFGLDFTSAPTSRKPITCAVCTFTNNHLCIETLQNIFDFAGFEGFLNHPGPWLAGLDFPFGQPRQLVQNLGWSESWSGYVHEVAQLGKAGFEQTLTQYRHSRSPGDKHHLRCTDVKAKACSPMMLHRVPVGKMFFEGAPRLLQAGVSVLPCRPTADNRIVIEVYPKLVVRKLIGECSYKNDTRVKQTTDQQLARQEIVAGLKSTSLRSHYGFSVQMSDTLANELINDPTGDSLDALCCAVQAAWAYQQRQHNYGIPFECDTLEGWVVDPELKV